MLPSDKIGWWIAFYVARMAVFFAIATLLVVWSPVSPEFIARLAIYYALEFSLGDLLAKRERGRFGRA